MCSSQAGKLSLGHHSRERQGKRRVNDHKTCVTPPPRGLRMRDLTIVPWIEAMNKISGSWTCLSPFVSLVYSSRCPVRKLVEVCNYSGFRC